MKYIFFFVVALVFSANAIAQEDSTHVQSDSILYRILKTDGGEIFGYILSNDEREIYVLTSDHRKIYIPQYMIKELIAVKQKELNKKGQFIGEDYFATRYFITTNGLPIKKGEHYIQWNLFGPDFQFGVGKNLGVGVMTSWIGIPIIGTIKKSFMLNKKTQFAIGGLAGTGSWGAPSWGGVLPFGTLSFGDRQANIAFSAGYGAVWENGNGSGRAITSIAGMIKLNPKISLVFDSFIFIEGKTKKETYTYTDYVYNPNTGVYDPVTKEGINEIKKLWMGLFVPGIRWHHDENKAFQFGFTGLFNENMLIPFPIPMIQWYRRL